VREVLLPLAATETVRLLADVPRALAAELAAALPPGTVQVIDLDEPEWADPEGLALQADALLDPRFGAPELPFTSDPAARRALAEAIARRAGGGRLTVQLAVNGILMHPEGFDPSDDKALPSGVGEALDLHARRLGAAPELLRQILAPLAFAEGEGLPVELWAPLASAIAGREMGEAIAGAMALAGPFVTPVEAAEAGDDAEDGEGDGEADNDRTLLKLLHPALATEIRSGFPESGRAAQAQIAVALLEQVPGQNWAKADPYVRDYVAGHALAAGLLPQLLTDPALFIYADPVALRAAVDAVPLEALGAPARTYRRLAPLLTRSEAPELLRAALLETAFVEDGLRDYAEAVHALGLPLPWRTLWSVTVPGVSAVTVGALPPASGESGEPGAEPVPVAVLVVPAGTPGALPLGGDVAVLVHGLLEPGPIGTVDPAAILRPDEEERAAAPLALSRGADYVRVWDRAAEEVVAAVISDVPFTGADLSPDGVLLLATERGARALRINR
jgi:hypothetical protein